MSEIDFAEIEKAMAELVNKAQGKERQQGLGQVAKERSQIAKEVETAHEQGDIATKRIIVASNAIRANPHSPRPTSKPSSPIMPPTPGRVMDFVPPSPPPIPTLPQEQSKEIDQELQKTVGELSNEYLTEQVRDSELGLDSYLDEPSKEIQEDVSERLDPVPPESPNAQEDLAQEDHDTSIEDLTGPSPAMSSSQEPTMSYAPASIDTLDESRSEDQLPEANELAQEVGKVHKIYGQKLPKEYLKKQSKDFSKKTKPKSTSGKKGFAFFFVLLMILASVLVWAAAAYLYFAA